MSSKLKLKKDSSLNMSKKAPHLKKLRLDAGWEVLRKSLDLDLSVFGLNAAGTAMESHVVFFNQETSADKCIVHSGDNRVGGEGVVESITLDLNKLKTTADHIKEISVVLTIDRAISRGHTFGLLSNAFLNLVDAETEQVIAEYDLDDQFSTCISVQIGSVVRIGDNWEFKEVATGYPDKDFEDIAHAYGI